MSRAALVVVGVLACASTLGAWWYVSAATSGPARIAGNSAAHTPPAVRRAAQPWARWTVTEQLAAGSVLVLQVETTHLDHALDIARELVEPVKPRYAEVMVYFHRPGRPATLPPRRVQWTPSQGYVETDYEH
ncbi:MAG: hypothetical protein AB7U83_02890 [Vicinamibacterales bacterium]